MLNWQKIRESRLALLGGGFFVFILLCVVADLTFPPPLDKVTYSTEIRDKEGVWLHGFTVADGEQRRWRLRAELEKVDPLFIERLIAIEDKRFYDHWGVDGLAVFRAVKSLAQRGRVVSGASTITMQTARLLEPRPRTIPSKLIEMVRAIQLERRLSKDEILALYLSLAPYGGNLEGVRAASYAYFGKEPKSLSDAQQALLIALPQAPEARRPDKRAKSAKQSRRNILKKLQRLGLLGEQAMQEADEASLPIKRKSFPRLAWHASLEARAALKGKYFSQTSLSAPLQQELEFYLAGQVQEINDKANISAIIVENKSRRVRALVGSADFNLPAGWVDMSRAQRSPGSTLKPFIYGLAFDDGVADISTLVDDAPYSFDGYRPENFTRSFYGDVTISEALQHSLNVPAVLALDKIGPRRFVSTLQASGVGVKMPANGDDNASLAIALGGVGMNMRELAMIYAGLANGGRVDPLVWNEQRNQVEEAVSFQFLSEQSADRLTNIMRKAPAPEGRSPSALSRTAPEIAFKTGTSYGYRDAWSAGYTNDYTVIVWVGHPAGTPRTGMTGRIVALPMLFDIFDLLAYHQPDRERGPNEALALEDDFQTGRGLVRLTPLKKELAPEIVFPEDNVTVYYSKAEARGLSLSARGGAGKYQWYIDEMKVTRNETNRAIWYPENEGFFKVTVVDAQGGKTSSQVRVSFIE